VWCAFALQLSLALIIATNMDTDQKVATKPLGAAGCTKNRRRWALRFLWCSLIH
jgi:hypothetical protein